jgi:hypothetical protein
LRINFLSLSFIFIFTVFYGCGDKSRPSDLPKLYPVNIKTFQEGSPLIEAQIDIYNIDKVTKYRVAGGVTNDSGEVIIQTYGYKGAPVGKYKVTAVKIIKGELPPGTKLSRFNQPDKYNLVDKSYSTEELSNQEIEIVAGKNEFSIDFGAPVRYIYEAGVKPPGKMPNNM